MLLVISHWGKIIAFCTEALNWWSYCNLIMEMLLNTQECITLLMHYSLIGVYGHFSQELPVFISSWIWSSRNQWILIKLCFRMFSSFLLSTLIEVISIPLKRSLLAKKYSMDYIMETFLKQIFPYQLPLYAPGIVNVIEKVTDSQRNSIHSLSLFSSLQRSWDEYCT